MPVHSLFGYKNLNAKGVHATQQVAESFSNLLDELTSYCPEGREFSIVKTKLEEASFFAKKAVSSSPENQD